MGNDISTPVPLPPKKLPIPVIQALPKQLPQGHEREYLEKRRAYIGLEKKFLDREPESCQWPEPPSPRMKEIRKRQLGLDNERRRLEELELAFLKTEVVRLDKLMAPGANIPKEEDLQGKMERLGQHVREVAVLAKEIVGLAKEDQGKELRGLINIGEAKEFLASLSACIDGLEVKKEEPPMYKS